jgi:hypothetical protein
MYSHSRSTAVSWFSHSTAARTCGVGWFARDAPHIANTAVECISSSSSSMDPQHVANDEQVNQKRRWPTQDTCSKAHFSTGKQASGFRY